VTTRLVPLRLLSPADIDAWRDLAGRSLDANPFFEPELVLPAAKHLGGGEVGLLTAGNGDGWSACLPVRSGRLGGVVKSLVSWRHPPGRRPGLDRRKEACVKAIGKLRRAA
jgi:hypothetical protein